MLAQRRAARDIAKVHEDRERKKTLKNALLAPQDEDEITARSNLLKESHRVNVSEGQKEMQMYYERKVRQQRETT